MSAADHAAADHAADDAAADHHAADYAAAADHAAAILGTPFTVEDIAFMRAILADPRSLHTEQTARSHVEHCLQQMVRFPHLAAGGAPFRGPQWGLNLGRAQEILESRGGRAAWWPAFEPLLVAEDWPALEARARRYIRVLGLEQPSDEFVSRA